MKKRVKETIQTMSSLLRSMIVESRISSLLLIAFTLLSLSLSNIPISKDVYTSFWYTLLPVFENYHLPSSPILIINDILMPLFFFVVGYEIRHELFSTHGSINSPQKAMLPLVAALGGVLMPALLFALINKGTHFSNGWAIPTATDIAFSLAVFSVISTHIPSNVKILLMALAVFDDLIAICIIALFYGKTLDWIYFSLSLLLPVTIYYLQKIKTYRLPAWMFIPLYGCLWFFIHLAGIHPTISGIIMAFIIPNHLAERAFRRLNPIVSFVILPLFVLSNTAIQIDTVAMNYLTSSLAIGIFVGLLVGKPLGITLAVMVSNRLHITKLATGVRLSHIVGVGTLAGIGFTMSIFIGNLSFDDHFLVAVSKLAVIIASVCAAILGIIVLRTADAIFQPSKKNL